MEELLRNGLQVARDDVVAQVPLRVLRPIASCVDDDARLRPIVDGAALTQALLKRFPELEEPPTDASFRIRDGRPRIVAAKQGVTISPEDVVNTVSTAIASNPPPLRVSVPGRPLDPKITDARARTLGVKEQLSSFKQAFPYAPYRVQNIGRAARFVDGTVLLPGETFSLNDVIKERTPKNGYTEGTVIGPGGVFREDLGGGVSTAATAVWTAAFFAGMERVETRAHSIYISRYAPGLEATVAWGVFDMRFRNATDGAVLLTAKTTDTSITVRFWGTLEFDRVKAEFGPKHRIRPFAVVYDDSPTCLGQQGMDGFTIDVDRVFIIDGAEANRETITTTYQPSPRVICT